VTRDPIRTAYHKLLAQDSWERPYVNSAREAYDALAARIAVLEHVAEAACAYHEAADWYRRCLEAIQDRQVVRGLAEAKAAFISADFAFRDAVAAMDKAGLKWPPPEGPPF
jgi:hypothetical protein